MRSDVFCIVLLIEDFIGDEVSSPRISLSPDVPPGSINQLPIPVGTALLWSRIDNPRSSHQYTHDDE